MAHYTCIYQQQQIDASLQQALEGALVQFASKRYGFEIPVHWLAIAEGNGYSAGEPSRVSVLNMHSPERLDQSEREQLLHELSSVWRGVSGCSVDELVVVVSDPTP